MKTIASLTNEINETKDKLLQVEHEITRINIQLKDARMKCAATKDYSDAGWYRATTTALQYKNLERRKLTDDLGRLKRERHDLEENGFPQKFIKAAKLLLDTETFLAIVKAAGQESEVTS